MMALVSVAFVRAHLHQARDDHAIDLRFPMQNFPCNGEREMHQLSLPHSGNIIRVLARRHECLTYKLRCGDEVGLEFLWAWFCPSRKPSARASATIRDNSFSLMRGRVRRLAFELSARPPGRMAFRSELALRNPAPGRRILRYCPVRGPLPAPLYDIFVVSIGSQYYFAFCFELRMSATASC